MFPIEVVSSTMVDEEEASERRDCLSMRQKGHMPLVRPCVSDTCPYTADVSVWFEPSRMSIFELQCVNPRLTEGA